MKDQINAKKSKAKEIFEILERLYRGNAKQLCALEHKNAYELLVATILSAQCTDERVNLVMKEFKKRYPDVKVLAEAKLEDIEEIIKPTGFYKNKAKSLLRSAEKIVKDYHGEVPDELDKLITLPGVGRKTAQVVLSVFFDKPGLPVDTHVARLAKRLGLTDKNDPDKIEDDLKKLFEPSQWGLLSLRLILHGRKVCRAKKPNCGECELLRLCDYGGLTFTKRTSSSSQSSQSKKDALKALK